MSNIVKFTIIFLIILKLLVLPLGSHPFDFAAFVYQARSYFEYGINPLFYLNKGVPIIALFYLPYSFYSSILNFFGGYENILLLHVLYKLPLLIFDLGTIILIWKIIDHFQKPSSIKNLAIILWLGNPFIFWMSEFQGQYAIFVVFSVVLALYYALVRERIIPSFLILAFATSIYYYPIILIPFLILWFLRKNYTVRNAVKVLFKSSVAYLIGLALAFLPFILSPVYASSLIKSLLYHSAPDAPQNYSVITVPLYSLFRLPYYLLTGNWPSNVASPAYFKVVGMMTFIGLVIVMLYAVYRMVTVFIRKKYEIKQFIFDSIFVTTVFVVFIGKLQSHYLLWLFPLYVLSICINRTKAMVPVYIFIGVIPIIVILGHTNLSIFLLDILPWNTIPIYVNHSDFVLALGGFSTVFLLIGLLVLSKENNSVDENRVLSITKSYFIVWIVFYLLCVGMIIGSYVGISMKGVKPRLASESQVYKYSFESQSISNKQEGIDYEIIPQPDTGFEENYINAKTFSGYVNKNVSPWYAYNQGDYGKFSVSMQKKEKFDGTQALLLTAERAGAKGSVALAKENFLIPVDYKELYSIKAMVKANNISGGTGKMTVRFFYPDKSVISGSDIDIGRVRGTSDWKQIHRTVIVPRPAAYIQLVFALDDDSSGSVAQGSSVYFDNVSLSKQQTIESDTFDSVRPKGNKQAIYQNIIRAPEASKKFTFLVRVYDMPIYAKANSVTLNKCNAKFSAENIKRRHHSHDFIASFPTACINTDQENNVIIQTTNARPANVSFDLVHSIKNYPVPDSRKKIQTLLAFIAGGLFVMAIMIGIVSTKSMIRKAEKR